MDFEEKAIINKSKADMKLWTATYVHYLKKGNGCSYSSIRADESIREFNKTFNETGNTL